MKHLRLFKQDKDLDANVLSNPELDFPIVSYSEDNYEVNYLNVPIISAKVNIIDDSDAYSWLDSGDFNIKSLTVDGELKYKKDTWVKSSYEISANNFEDSNVGFKFSYPSMFFDLNSGCRNVLVKHEGTATNFFVFYRNSMNYGYDYVTGQFLNIEENIDRLFIKKIDDNTYDLTDFCLRFNELDEISCVILADANNNILEQTIEFEKFGNEIVEQTYEVTKDNFLSLTNHGYECEIIGDINPEDYVLLRLSVDNEPVDGGLLPISLLITELGVATLSNNKLSINFNGASDPSMTNLITISYAIIDKTYDESLDMADYVKNVTIISKQGTNYLIPLSVGIHDVEIELIQNRLLPLFNNECIIYANLLKLNGQYISTDYAFYRSNLTNVLLPYDLTSIGNQAFNGCYDLTSVVIPDSVTSIGGGAFANCGKLDLVHLGNGVTSIGESAFAYCNSLTSITIPYSVTSIGDYAFRNCIFQPDKFINNSSVSGYPWGAVLYDIVQEDGLCINGTTAVKSRPNATHIVIPDIVISIGDSAFYDCNSLSSITIPNSVTSLGSDAFYRCNNLTSITIPDSVTSIGSHAFSNCSNLTSVTIGNSVTSIYGGAFYYCRGLTSITCRATTAPTLQDSWVFYALPTNGKLYVPSGSDYNSWLSKLPSGWAIEYI